MTVLHPPYTGWNLANVAIGAAIAPHLYVGRRGCPRGVPARSGRLRPRPRRAPGSTAGNVAVDAGASRAAVTSLAGAVAIGVIGAVTISLTLVPFVLVGAFIVLAYNLEWFGGRFHNAFWLAASWGAFPVLTGYWVNALALSVPAVLSAGACMMLTVAQRRLSTPVRELRRGTVSLSGEQRLVDDRVVVLDVARLAAPLDGALKAIAIGMMLLAAGLVLARLQ